jgi:hypothetical protein
VCVLLFIIINVCIILSYPEISHDYFRQACDHTCCSGNFFLDDVFCCSFQEEVELARKIFLNLFPKIRIFVIRFAERWWHFGCEHFAHVALGESACQVVDFLRHFESVLVWLSVPLQNSKLRCF